VLETSLCIRRLSASGWPDDFADCMRLVAQGVASDFACSRVSLMLLGDDAELVELASSAPPNADTAEVAKEAREILTCDCGTTHFASISGGTALLQFSLATGIDGVLVIEGLYSAQFHSRGRLERIAAQVQRLIAGLNGWNSEEGHFATQALRDELTGIPNYRSFLAEFESRLGTSVISGRTFTLAILNVRGLAEINALSGHRLGNLALKTFVEVLSQALRPIDFLSRYAAGEFAIICDVDKQALEELILKPVCQSLEECGLTFSSGVANFPEDGSSGRTLFDHAEASLRRARP
jgi:diguanylate cyclase (GGDEF)-like protein